MPLSLTPYITSIDEIQHRLAMTQGGGDGICRGDGDEGEVTQSTPLSMAVTAGTFRGYIAYKFVRLSVASTTDVVTAPTGGVAGDLRRIDLVQYSLNGGLNIKTGEESATPSPPVKDSNSIEMAYIYCRNGMTSIKNADDSTNGYIVDQRAWV